ncbi:MAG TPA: hypothetical protein DCZ94_06505 [Lentisphaeria bacterium]|nr:MAG: hypothetical protein A2X48_10875 [Lentisphaerae bacterium GWF2_49_21]HBC86587.1 hypothetical protein [Lentisphaeria bacterium]
MAKTVKKTSGSEGVGKEVARLKVLAVESLSSFNVLFEHASGNELQIHDLGHSELLSLFSKILFAIDSELDQLSKNKNSAFRRSRIADAGPDSVDYLNSLLAQCRKQSFSDILIAAIIEAATMDQVRMNEKKDDEMIKFKLAHGDRLVKSGIKLLLDYMALLSRLDTSESTLARLSPSFNEKISSSEIFNLKTDLQSMMISELQERFQRMDPFLSGDRAFRFSESTFFPAKLGPVRPVSQFYGFPAAKEFFRKYLSAFSLKGENFPLLISSLPGLGKTHFTISYTLSFENLTLILCEPHHLEKPLVEIIEILGKRSNRRFVLFFDDVDTRKIDWYYFRTNIGGSCVLPENITVVIASNYEYPANILSRGGGFTFPFFDEITCQEMVHDFLMSMGMKTPRKELVSVIAADYVEDFGQHVFEELSPRTLVRYLERYHNDPVKRKKALDLSKQDVITAPDAMCFYEANQKVLQRLKDSI